MPNLCIGVIGNVTSRRDDETFGLIVFVLGSVFFFWYRSSIILTDLRIRAVQDIIHFTHESRTCIQSSIKTRPQNPLGCLESRLDLLPCHKLKLMLTSQESGFAVPGWPSSHCLPAAPLGGFLVEFEFTPLAPPSPIWKDVDLQVVF